MPTISEAINKLATQTELAPSQIQHVSVSLTSLNQITNTNDIDQKASALRIELMALSSYGISSEVIEYALLALNTNYPKNDIELFKLNDDDNEIVFISSGEGYGKNWLTKYIQENGYINPFNRQEFSELDKTTISKTTHIALDYNHCIYHRLNRPNERIDLTMHMVGLGAMQNQENFDFAEFNRLTQRDFHRLLRDDRERAPHLVNELLYNFAGGLLQRSRILVALLLLTEDYWRGRTLFQQRALIGFLMISAGFLCTLFIFIGATGFETSSQNTINPISAHSEPTQSLQEKFYNNPVDTSIRILLALLFFTVHNLRNPIPQARNLIERAGGLWQRVRNNNPPMVFSENDRDIQHH